MIPPFSWNKYLADIIIAQFYEKCNSKMTKGEIILSRYNTVLYNWTEVTNRLLHDKQLLAHFLRFSAGMYKQSFSDAALIYHQNPYATKVATLEVWNRLGRRVNRGEHSIAVFGEDCKCKHLFDITQTEGRRIPDLWKLDESLAADLTAAINQKYGAECKTIQETLAAVSVDNLKCRSTDMNEIISQMGLSDEQKKAYQQSVVSAVRFMVSCRCELDSDMKVSGGLNLNAVDLFHDTRDLIRFCDLVQRTAKDSLLEVEREVFLILNKRREKEHEQEIKSDRTVSQGNAVHGQPAGTGAPSPTNRQMGQNVAGVDENRTSDRGSGSGYGSTVADHSEGDRQAGGKSLGSAGRTVSQGESPTDGVRADAAVGENPSADAGAYHHEGDRVSDSELTVAYLKECYLHADFNRRLDSYEMAGLAFTDGADLKIDEITFFNRFHADKFSPAQAQEIREIMMVAMLNREKEQIAHDEPEQAVSAAEPDKRTETDIPVQPEPVTAEETEPVIVNNFPLISGNLPLLTDESIIAGILTEDQFFNRKCGEIAAYFADNHDENDRIAFLKTAYNTEYCEMNIGSVRVGYKTTENGLMVWEGSSYLSRTKEAGLTWDFVAAYIAKLIEENRYLKEPALQRSTKNADRNQLVIYSFNENDGVVTADCSIGDNLFETEVLRTDDDTPYLNYKGRPIQFTSQQAYDLEQFELFRAPITHDRNGYYADDLDAGDQIRLDGEIWTVVIKNDYTIRLSNSEKSDPDNVQNIYGKWQEKLTKLGFEFIPQSREIETPVFAETAAEAPEPESGGIQLTLFGEPVPIEKTEKKERPKKKTVSVSLTAPTSEMIDHVLRAGSNDTKSIERIVAWFQKKKSAAENAEFLRREFGTGGRGYKYSPPDYSSASLVAAWFDKNGITAAISNTAFPEGKNSHITWEQAAERIGEMLREGEYCEQDKIDRAADYELQDISERLLFLERDVEGDFFLPKEMTEGGFPECEAKVKAALTDPETLKAYIAGMKLFLSQYEQNPDILRMHYHKPKELLQHLEDLLLSRSDFITKPDFNFQPQFFITDDEKDHFLTTHGSGVESGKFRIAEYFAEEHTLSERIQFLKHEYGDGGMGHAGFDEWHDAKGIRITKSPFSADTKCTAFMKWNEVAERIERLIAENKYISQKDIDERIRSAKRDLQRPDDGTFNQYVIERAKKVLQQYGIPLDEVIPKPPENVEQEDTAFMSLADERFVELMNSDEGLNYAIFAPDLSLVDGGVWELDEEIDFRFAAAQILDVSESDLIPVHDYELFRDLVNDDVEVENAPEQLAKLKADSLSNAPDMTPIMETAEVTTPTATAEEPAAEPTVLTPERMTVTKKAEPKTGIPVTYHYNPSDTAPNGAKSRFKANIEAIQTLQRVEAENRYATPEEQSVMAKYVGWGGIPQAFVTDRMAADSYAGNLGELPPTGWETEQKQLLELLSPEEYKAARSSTQTSFFTPPEISDGIYQALSQFGFTGGNVLEPSMGVGNFFAKMPSDMRDSSRLYGVELDSISGRIAQQLYPQDRIQVRGFEQTHFNNNSFDVVIGNVPFGDYRVSDKAYDKHKFKIHDYFAAKSVDKVKPGGVVAIVTSKFTMDKLSEKARRYLAERCDLLGAVRLPDNAFKKNAGTETTTDILFLKKRETLTIEVPDWVHMGQTPDGIPCNQYFVDHPDMVLGTMAWDERMKGKYGEDSRVTTCIGDDTIPLAEQIREAVAKIEGSIETIEAEERQMQEGDVIPADPSVRNYTHTLVDGQLYFRDNEVMLRVQETGKTLDRMMGMHRIRQAAMAVIDAQAAGCSDEELAALQRELNAVYDKFRKAYGNITDSVNERCFRQDDDYNTLAALEIVDVEKKTVEKAEIFTKRTIQPEVEITSVETPQEALQVSLDKLGRVDIPYMAELVGCEPEQVISELGTEIFRNPAKIKDDEPFSGYEDASEYLSGNVREKLKIAQDYAKLIDQSFERNVTALQSVIPKDLEADEISVRIGANWIEVEDYNRFFREVCKGDTFFHPVTRTKFGEYKIDGLYQDKSVAATETFGTPRMSSYHIFENLLNQRDIVVRDRIDDGEGKFHYEVNAKETQLAKEKARQMKEAFKSWVWEDIDRRDHYVEKYNYLFNAIRGREYDGSHQTFPGMNPAIKLRAHQENAVLRAKLGGNTLLAHCVGAGKSFEMIAATMEKKRLGLISKACVVVPKHLTLQMASEWMRLYPNAKLLVARPEDFTKDNRQKFIARCVTGDYDAVIMSFTQFERIPMSDEYRKQFMEKELAEIMDALEDVDSSDRTSVKALERQKMKIEERLEKLMSSKKDNSLCFEKLGFDYLVCDEAHNYKNCYVATKMSNVAGVQTTAAQKSEDMLMKTQYLNDKYGCNNILYSTGTPVSNSMVEFYVMQRYLRPDLLDKAGLQTFDDWAGTFGEVVSQLEIKPAGNGFQMKNRFSKFVNIPELMQMYKEFADIQTPDMIKLPVPALKTGAPIVVSAKPDERQQAYMKELAARSERIHNGCVDPSEDNMLKITHEARLLGLDSRCIFLDAEPTPDSKVMMLIDNLEQNYHDTAEQKGVQIVFCDIAINEDDEHFSVYEAIKDELVRRGIPRDEICFAGDAKTDKARADMFEQLRKGEKRFILASTSKLGTGANVQDRICAIHHLDIPWKPADLTQQDGRGIRQGNMFPEVGIYHYLTENTFDAYLMGIITNKAKFISQIMTSKDPVRVSEDVDETVLTYSQMQAIASGNPMIKEKIQLDNDIAVLKTLEAEHKKSVFKMQELAERRLPQQIENYAALLEKASGDLRAFQEQHPDNAEFQIEIDGKTYTDRAEAGAEIEKALIKCSTTGESIRLGKYFGFDLTIEKNQTGFFDSGTVCSICLQGNLKYYAELSLNNNIGNVRRIENLAGIQINAKIKQFSSDLDKAKQDLEDARAAMTKPFERAQELADMQKRLDYVNEQLSMNSDDEPVPVSETHDNIAAEKLPSTIKVGMVSVAVPAAAYSDRPRATMPQEDQSKPTKHKVKR